MKKTIIIFSLLIATGEIAMSQSALDAYSISQPDMKGTARYMGMAGAFGALGGDLSSISQNPAGIGVYRSSDIGFTLDLDLQSSNSQTEGQKYSMSQTKFLLNNIGAVLTLKLPSTTFPNLNFGFTYNKGASFNRVFGGNVNNLRNSMSNYIAGIADANQLIEDDFNRQNGYDPYNPGYNDYAAPWITILGYDSYLISPDLGPATGATKWYGLWDKNSMTGQNTSGSGSFLMKEWGGTNEYNIVLGGNISNVLFWGMNFDIININYRLSSIWAESLDNALVPTGDSFVRTTANWNLNNIYTLSGTGFNYQLGFIVKPVQPLRIGFAFHTPTWYSLNEEFGASVDYLYGGNQEGTATVNNGYLGYNSYNLRTPWKIIASAAGVIGNNFILSFDYEWANYGKMHFSEPTYYNDGWYDYPYYLQNTGPVANSNFFNGNDPYAYENSDIANYYKSSNTFRVGVEFKPIPSFSIRAGYANVSSPVKKEATQTGEIYTAGTMASFKFDNTTNYITFGLGYRYKRVYADLAYVFKKMDSQFYAYTPLLYDKYKDMGYLFPESYTSGNDVYRITNAPQSKISFTNNQLVLSIGYRF